MGAALCSNGNKIVVVDATKAKQSAKIRGVDQRRGRSVDISDKDAGKVPRRTVKRENEKLWTAVENNDLAAAELYLDFNEVNESQLYDGNGQTMLHLCAELGHSDMMMMLIERTGAKPDMVNNSLATPLHLACRTNQPQVVKFLLGCGIDVNVQDEHGQTPFLICTIHSHFEIVQMLIEASIAGHLTDPLEIDLANQQGLTALNCAAIKGDLEMVKCIVSRGGAQVDRTSPKGCTPLIYAGRGGYAQVVEFLLQKKASALKQDNAGGTVLHHAIEKGHLNVLEQMITQGVDVYSAIEIADNAGRTPLFEAVESLQDSGSNDETAIQIIKILTKNKTIGGFHASPNVVNYNGQTPLFLAAKQGSLSAVKALIQCGAKADLNNGELVKPEDESDEEFTESEQEKNFMKAFKNCTTPLHVAAVLGHDQIVHHLIMECGADPNYQTKIERYSVLHLCVLANRPELLTTLVQTMGVLPMQEDRLGRALLDIVYQHMPSHLDHFQNMLESMHVQHQNPIILVEDDRKITGVMNQGDANQIYAIQDAKEQAPQNFQNTINLDEFSENELIADCTGSVDPRIEKAYGMKVALCLVSQNWQNKEQALKYALKATEKFLTRSEINAQNINTTLVQMVEGALATVSLTCREKIVKVFNLSLQMFNLVVQSTRVEKDYKAVASLAQTLRDELLIQKFLLHSEQSNTRVTNKVHEAMLDLAYQTHLGEDIVTREVYEQIKRLTGGSNHKALLAQLALLYKLVNTFNVHKSVHKDGDEDVEGGRALTWYLVLEIVMPSLNHSKDEIRNASIKILVDVQRKTGLISIGDLDDLPDKLKENVWESISQANQGPTLNQGSPSKDNRRKLNIVNLEIPDMISAEVALPGKLNATSLENYKKIIQEKGTHKDWTQREIALNSMQECFNLELNNQLDNEDEFLAECSALLQTALDDNNIQIYLIAVEVVLQFIQKLSTTEAVYDCLQNIIQSLVLHTTDTNTRVRKRSVEVVNQVWDIAPLNRKASQTSSQIIANVITDSALNEKAIVGRLGLFIKKSMLIEKQQDLSKKPLSQILGTDYEQLTQFACQWCLHKNTKVRQCALKLVTEICRMNSIDPRGLPFKKRIVNFVSGLRSSIREPLVKKINEVCQLANPQSTQYIDLQEIEFGSSIPKAINPRIDIKKVKEGLPQIKGAQDSSLPAVGKQSAMPSVQAGGIQPTIVLPHSEPLSESQLESSAHLIEFFSKELMTCFYSQTWSSRLCAIQKVDEQLCQLDPNRRDAMSSEGINSKNMPPELSFKTLMKFCEEGLKDPVLKNFITVLSLVQTALPMYFRYLRAEQIKIELAPLVQHVIQKMSDLKQKVREASMNFCLYLSHQEMIGTEVMIQHVLNELDPLSWEKDASKKDMQNTFGNSNMIVSCLSLLNQYQLQTSLVKRDSKYFDQFTDYINKGLKHSNPQVRKQAEQLFKTMYGVVGESYIQELKNQKPGIVTKLQAEAKSEATQKDAKNDAEKAEPAQEEKQEEKAVVMTGEEYLSNPAVQNLFKNNELAQLKSPNPKKRLIAIIEIKKLIQQKLTQLNAKSALEMIEPLSMLLRHLLRDENSEVYLESLQLLKFVVGNLAQHLSALDLHLMMGQFVQVIVQGQQNIRTRVASDKVIVYFSKHTNIGSLVVAKEVLKNIERLTKSALFQRQPGQPVDEALEDKKQILCRFYSLLQMLLQQFSIVLCYQPDFYQKSIDVLADTMSRVTDEPQLKSACTQLVVSLYQIDGKLLDQAVSNLDFTKKASFKKIIIELENSSQKGLVPQNQNLVTRGASSQRSGSPDVSFRDTQQSFTSLNSRHTVMSPGLNMNRRLSRDQKRTTVTGEVNTSKENHGKYFPQNQTLSGQDSWMPRQQAQEQNQTTIGWLERKNQESSALPSIEGVQGTRRRQLGQGFVAGGSNKAAGFNRNEFNMTGDHSAARKGILNSNNEIMTTIGGQNGVGGALLNAPKKTEKQDKTENTPLYVPSSRPALIKKPGENSYQPTILERNVSKENPLANVPALERYSEQKWGAGLTGSNQMGSSRMNHQLY